jgi:hypothetical protein
MVENFLFLFGDSLRDFRHESGRPNSSADKKAAEVKTFSSRPLPVTRFGTVALVMVCALAVPPSAYSLPPAKSGARALSAASKGGTSILGVVWNIDNTPIPGARVQLRNLVSGKVDATAVANQTGHFTFNQIEGGRYLVELIGQNGKVVTVGHAFVIAPGESVATFVRMGTKVPWFTGFFNNAATAVTSSAASQGITAIAPVQLNESPPGTVGIR